MRNESDRASNSINHESLIDILRHFRFPTQLSALIDRFNSDQTISMAFEGGTKPSVPFLAGVLQGSPLLPIVFVNFAACLSNPDKPPGSLEKST